MQVDWQAPPWQELVQQYPPAHEEPPQLAGEHAPASMTLGGLEHEGTPAPPSVHA
jgi:hypothetical protein